MNHRPNRFPAPCSECGPERVKATCCIDEHAVDEYGTDTIKPKCVCPNYCPVCGKSQEASA